MLVEVRSVLESVDGLNLKNGLGPSFPATTKQSKIKKKMEEILLRDPEEHTQRDEDDIYHVNHSAHSKRRKGNQFK